MKILIFNWRDLKHKQGGGAELYLHEQAKRWAKKGNEVLWITSSVKNEPPIEVIDRIKFIRKGGIASLYFFAAINYFRYGKNAEAIIDAENGIPFFTPLYSRKKKILLIHHVHKDQWFKQWGFPINWIGYFLETKIMPLIYKKTRIVTVSQSSKENIKKLLPKNKIEIVYNAISKKYKPGKKSENPEIIFLGRLKKYKSIDVLLKAVSLYDKNLKVNIIGRGDDEERLKNLTKKLKLKKVVFHGFVSEKKKIKLLQKSWIAVNPSMIEGWSITNIEANACDLPVIGSNVPGIKDSVIDGKTGFLFKYGDYKELAGKIRTLLKNKKLREKMGKEAVKWSKNFSWDKSAEKFLKIIKKELKEK